MKLLNLKLNNQEWETLDGELTKNDYDKVNIIFLFGDTDVIKNDGNFLKLKDIYYCISLYFKHKKNDLFKVVFLSIKYNLYKYQQFIVYLA